MASNKKRIELPPDCEFSLPQVVQAWNDDADSKALGKAEMPAPTAKSASATDAILSFAVSIGSGVLSSVVYDQLKLLLGKMRTAESEAQ